MTQRGVASCILGCLVVFGLWGAANADHMTGRYTMIAQDARTANIAGSVLQLQQSGRNLMGQIAGANFHAQLQAETDGGNNARGFMTVQGGQRHYFEATWDQSGMRIALVALDNQGRPDYNGALILFFAREGGGSPGGQGQPGFGPPGQPGPGGQPAFGGQPGFGPPPGGQPGFGQQPSGQPGFGPPGQPGPGGQPSFGGQPGFGPPPAGQPAFSGQPGFGPPPGGQPGFGGPPGSGGQPGFPPQGQPGGGLPPSQQGYPGTNPPQPGSPPGQWPPQR